MRMFEKQYGYKVEGQCGGPKWQWDTVSKMALRFLTKGTGCGVESEVIYRSMELRDRNKFDKLDRNPKKKKITGI